MKLCLLPAFVLPFLAVLLLPVLFFPPVSAQTQSNAVLAGEVTDPSGSAISNAEITALPAAASAKPIETRSGADGNFSLSLAPGQYRVRVTHASFSQSQQEFSLAPGETKTWDVHLTLAEFSSSVIVTAQAQPIEANQVAAPVDVISRTEIDQAHGIWLAPTLASAPGVSFSQLGPTGGVTSLFIDGGNSTFTKVLLDGMPINQPGGAIDISNYAIDNIDKIEIVRGASSALYGSDAMDGVVQLFSHRGTTTTPQLILDADGGTFGTGHGSGELSGILGMFDYSLDAGYFSTGGQIAAPVDGQRPLDYFRDTTLSANLGWKFSDTDTLRLTVRNNASDAGQPGQTLFSDVPFAVDPGQHSDLHDFSSGLTWNFALGDHWKNQLTAYDSRFHLLGVFAPGPGGSFVDNFNRAGFDGRSTYLFHNGSVTLGYMNEVETGNGRHRENQAGYTELRFQVARRLTVTTGARAEDNASFGTRVVPRIGAAYALRYGRGFWGATRLRASYGLGIKEPDFIQSFSADPCFPGNPHLDPERSATVNAGVDQMLASGRVRVSLTYFHNNFYDIVSFQNGLNPPPQCEFGTGTYFNTDKARAFGANSTFEAQVTRWLSLSGNYSYDDTKVLKAPNASDPALVAGNRLFKRPLNEANVTLGAHWRGANWNLSGHYVGIRTDSDFLSFTSGGVCFGPCVTRDPSYFRLDMAATMPLRYGLSATAYFGNLLDRHYQDAVGYPALGYNYRVGIRYTWGGEAK